MTNASPMTRHARIVGTKRTVQQRALRRIDRPSPTGRPSERRTTRSPVTWKLAVRPLRHSRALHTSHPIPSVAITKRSVRKKALIRDSRLAAGGRTRRWGAPRFRRRCWRGSTRVRLISLGPVVRARRLPRGPGGGAARLRRVFREPAHAPWAPPLARRASCVVPGDRFPMYPGRGRRRPVCPDFGQHRRGHPAGPGQGSLQPGSHEHKDHDVGRPPLRRAQEDGNRALTNRSASVVPGVGRPVGRTLLQEGVAALGSLG